MNYETWLIEERGRVLEQDASKPGCLSEWHRAVKALWVADYGMRNAGDLLTAYDVDEHFAAAPFELNTGWPLGPFLAIPATPFGRFGMEQLGLCVAHR